MNYVQGNLFDMLGMTPTSQETKSRIATKKKTSKGNDPVIALPVTLCFGTYSKEIKEISGKQEVAISVLREYLIELGFQGFKNPALQIAYDKEKTERLLYVKIGAINQDFTTNHSVIVTFDDNDNITVSDGQLNCPLNRNDFEGFDDDEITVEMIYQKFIEVNPQYKGCELVSAKDCPVLLPYWGKSLINDKDIALPFTIMDSTGKKYPITKLEETTVECAIKKVCPSIAIKGRLAINQDKDYYFLVLSGGNPFPSPHQDRQKKFKKAEKKYKLPLQVYISTFNYFCELTQADFSGKEKITEKESTEFFSKKFAIFQDCDRKPLYIYISETNTLTISFVSGTKGTSLKTKLGKFVLEKGHLSFINALPLVPHIILEEILSYFRKDLTLESIVKICYDEQKKHFFVQYPKQTQATKNFIHYQFEPNLNPDIITVAEFHSHNIMPAFFSSTDTQDECGIGIYGVIGKLNLEQPEIKIRVGYNGVFSSLDNFNFYKEKGVKNDYN